MLSHRGISHTLIHTDHCSHTHLTTSFTWTTRFTKSFTDAVYGQRELVSILIFIYLFIFFAECGGFPSVNLASPFLAFDIHCFPSTLSFLKQTESLIGDLKCQQDLWFPVLVTPSLKGLSSVTSLLCCPSWQAVQAFFPHMIHIVCILWHCLWPTYSLKQADNLSPSLPYLFSLHCLSYLPQAFPVCWSSDWLEAVWYVWYSVVLVFYPVN